MKLVTLNIQHGGGNRISAILEYLQSQNADVIVLTEFRANRNAKILRSHLFKLGFLYFAAASINPKENSVCIFSRQAFVPRTYSSLPVQDRHRLISAHFDSLAIYGVYFPQKKAKASLFQFLSTGKHQPFESAHFITGDFNTGNHFQDEEGRTFHCSENFKQLSESGLIDSWRSRNQNIKEFSWYSSHGNGFRIDHIFSNPEADNVIQDIYYDHATRESKTSDHSALIVESVR